MIPTAQAPASRRAPGRVRWLVAVLVVVGVLARAAVPPPTALPERAAAFVGVWLALCVQATPFLVLGVLVSGAVVAFLPADALLHVVPRNLGGAVVAAGLSGAVLPGCECASVPVARALLSRGTPPAAALTFMLAAPAVNPVVLVSTAVAFPGQPMVVIARFLASMLAAWLVGWAWILRRRGGEREEAVPPLHRSAARRTSPRSRWRLLTSVAAHDFLHAGAFLVLGSLVAAVVKVAVPAEHLTALGQWPVRAVLAMALLAVLVCVCSEADAFVAASFTTFSPTAQLVFMTVSPMVDLKLVAMQVGTFGTAFVTRFVPLTLLACLLTGTTVGLVAL